MGNGLFCSRSILLCLSCRLVELNEQAGLFVHQWMFVLYKSTNSTNCSDVTANCAVQYYCTAQYRLFTNIRAILNWTAVCMYSCTQTPKSQKNKLKKWQLLPPCWANAPTDRGEGSYPPILQCSGKALKLSSSHSPTKRLSPGGHL